MKDLGTLGGGGVSFGIAINASGQVVGHAVTASGASHAFLYSGSKMNDLGTLGGTESNAYGLNAAGQVVGYSQDRAGADHAFLYTNGTMLDLNSLVDRASRWIPRACHFHQ